MGERYAQYPSGNGWISILRTLMSDNEIVIAVFGEVVGSTKTIETYNSYGYTVFLMYHRIYTSPNF